MILESWCIKQKIIHDNLTHLSCSPKSVFIIYVTFFLTLFFTYEHVDEWDIVEVKRRKERS